MSLRCRWQDKPARSVRGRRQLIVYHFMFDPAWRRLYRLYRFCERPGRYAERPRYDFRSYFSSAARKLERYKARQGWNLRWISSFGSDFNLRLPRHAGLNRDTSSVQLPRREPGRERHGLRCILPPQPSHLSHLLDLCEAVKVDRRNLLDLTPTVGRRTLRTRRLAGCSNRHTDRRSTTTG